MANLVKFSYGTLATYKGLAAPDQFTIYFITDKPYIYYKGKRYGNEASDFELISGVELADNTLTVSYSNGSQSKSFTLQEATTEKAGLMSAADKAKLDKLDESLENNSKYNSAMDDNLATVQDHGGIKAGTTAAHLKTMNLSQVFDEILFPTIQPEAVAPSATLKLISTSVTPTIQEVGTTGSTVPTTSSFTTSFSKGSITIAGTKKQDRSGEKVSDSIYVNGVASNTTLPTKIAEGSTTYTYRVNYNEGPTPLDSKGNSATSLSKLSAGHVDSAAVTVNGVYPYFANNSSNASFSKLALTTSTTINIKFVAEGPNKHAFKLPAKYTLTSVTMLNTLSGKYENFGTSKWTVSEEAITVQGASVPYKKYTRNDSGFSGDATFNVTFSK